jgi:hypothetical protein
MSNVRFHQEPFPSTTGTSLLHQLFNSETPPMNSKIVLVALSTALTILGCSSEADSQIKLAKMALESSLNDPASVQYRDIQSFSESVVCGEYNAKNKFGGYMGFRRFVFAKGSIELDGRTGSTLCNNDNNKFGVLAESSRKESFGISAYECDKAKEEAKGAAAPASGGTSREQLRVKVACGESR